MRRATGGEAHAPVRTPDNDANPWHNGIVHTLSDGHSDWRAREEAMTEGARRAAQTQYPGVAFVPTDILWHRAEIERSRRDASDLPPAIAGIGHVIVGHSPGAHPRWIRPNAVCIDTGVHVDDYGHLTIARHLGGRAR